MTINITINLSGAFLEKVIKKSANPKDLEYVANFVEVVEIKYLHFEGKLIKQPDSLIKLDGFIDTKIVQQCSITANLLEKDYDVSFTRLYSMNPPKIKEKAICKKEINITFSEEEVDFLEDNTLKLQDLITEELLLTIDPYVRIGE